VWLKKNWIDLMLLCVCVAVVAAMIVEGPQRPSTATTPPKATAESDTWTEDSPAILSSTRTISGVDEHGNQTTTIWVLPAAGDPSPPMPISTVPISFGSPAQAVSLPVDLGDPGSMLTMPILDGGTLRTDCECACEACAVPTWAVVSGCAALAAVWLALLVIAVLLVRLHSRR
jgi:hypothetical protein